MHPVRPCRSLVPLVILGATLAAAPAALGGSPSGVDPAIVGTWTTRTATADGTASNAVYAFTPDGRVVAIADTSSVATALGSWTSIGDTAVALTLVGYVFAEDGSLAGTLTARERITLDGPDTFTGSGVATIVGTDGEQVEATPITVTATRLAAIPSERVAAVITASGRRPAAIRGAIAEYTELLGGTDNGGEPGSRPDGFRTITWDGVPEDQSAPNGYDAAFFNAPESPRARGAVFEVGEGTALVVSAAPDNAAGVLPRFGHINPTYPDIFSAYSREKLFSPVGTNIADLTFFVPGTDTPAVVRGFGAVYLDVDTAHTAFEYFDADDASLGTFETPIADQGFSFLGVAFPEPIVHRVRITYGTAPLGDDDGPGNDVAVMDDFIYGEPQPIE
jgi:hypothetical protein